MAATTFPIGGRSILALACVAVLTACGGSTPPPPPPVRVTVDGVTQEVDPGTTLKELGLHAHDGRLLSVSGAVLDPLTDPGEILVTDATAGTAGLVGDDLERRTLSLKGHQVDAVMVPVGATSPASE